MEQTLAERLKAYREKKEYTRERMARIIGVGISTYSAWERNVYQPLGWRLTKVLELLEKARK